MVDQSWNTTIGVVSSELRFFDIFPYVQIARLVGETENI